MSDHGKHRSVGMADLLRHCLIHSHGWDVPKVIHLAELSGSWDTLCSACADCEAHKAGPRRALAYKMALDHYENAAEVIPWQARA